MTTEVSVMYRDVKIDYNENADRWTFSLRGRERSVETLTKAKEAIDKVPKEKNTFERVPVYCYEGYSTRELKKGEITSIAQSTNYSSNQQVWVSVNGNREKFYVKNVFPVTEANSAVASELDELNKELIALEARIKAAENRLIPYVVKDDSL